MPEVRLGWARLLMSPVVRHRALHPHHLARAVSLRHRRRLLPLVAQHPLRERCRNYRPTRRLRPHLVHPRSRHISLLLKTLRAGHLRHLRLHLQMGPAHCLRVAETRGHLRCRQVRFRRLPAVRNRVCRMVRPSHPGRLRSAQLLPVLLRQVLCHQAHRLRRRTPALALKLSRQVRQERAQLRQLVVRSPGNHQQLPIPPVKLPKPVAPRRRRTKPLRRQARPPLKCRPDQPRLRWQEAQFHKELRRLHSIRASVCKRVWPPRLLSLSRCQETLLLVLERLRSQPERLPTALPRR